MRWDLFILLVATTALVVQPQTLHADPPLTQDQLAQLPWHLTPFLTGTTKQLRDTVNGTLEEQLKRKNDKLQRINDANADLQKNAKKREQDSADRRPLLPGCRMAL